jgi:hypothetical protein
MSSFPPPVPSAPRFGQPVQVQIPPKPTDLPPEGRYSGTIVGCEIGESTTKGTPFVRIMFDVDGCERDVTIWMPADKPDSVRRALSQLQTLGWNGNFDEPELRQVDENGNLIRYPVMCKHEWWDGGGNPAKAKWQAKWELPWVATKTALNEDSRAKLAAIVQEVGHAPPTRQQAAAAKSFSPPPAPKPATPRPPVPTKKTHTMQSAWADILAAAGNDTEMATEVWGKVIEERQNATGEHMDNFGSDDWEWVTNRSGLPF